MKLSEKILALRKKAGLSQEDLANKLDVSRQSVYKWESDLATPEFEKLKSIAKLFNVTFDYLMNDDIVEEIISGENKRKVIKRSTYVLGEKLSIIHADIDHGYTKKRKVKCRDADHIFDYNIQKMNDDLKKVGATEVIRIQPDAAIAYFYNEAQKTFGFYYQGKIQLVCPIENFVSFDFDKGNDMVLNTRKGMLGLGFGKNGINGIGVGSMPSQTVVTSSAANASLYYYENKSVNELKLTFNVANLYYDVKDLDEYNFITDALMYRLIENLRNVSSRLNAYATQSEQIKSGKIIPSEFSLEEISDVNSELKEEYEAYIVEIEEMTAKDNRWRLIKRLIGLGVVLSVVALPILGIILLCGVSMLL